MKIKRWWRIDNNGSTQLSVGGPGSVTASMLSDTILKYLKPEIMSQPTISDQPERGKSLTLSSQSEGKYLTHQWYRNGEKIPGATQAVYNTQC